MEIARKNLNELQRPEKNVRLHGDRQIKEYVRSIEMFGQIRPLVIDENNVVLAGNGLLTALKQMGRETADCYVVTGLTSKQKKKLMLADNKIFELGINDPAAFDEMMCELGEGDIPGFDDEFLKSFTMSYSMMSQMPNVARREENMPQTQMTSSPTAAVQFNPPPSINHVKESEAQSVQRFVTCPKCGEKIYL